MNVSATVDRSRRALEVYVGHPRTHRKGVPVKSDSSPLWPAGPCVGREQPSSRRMLATINHVVSVTVAQEYRLPTFLSRP